jgi:hypothetical protein
MSIPDEVSDCITTYSIVEAARVSVEDVNIFLRLYGNEAFTLKLSRLQHETTS